MDSLIELKHVAAEFNVNTKKIIPCCREARINIDETGISDMWGDFKTKKGAKKACMFWNALAKEFNGKMTCEMNDGNYRIIIKFK